MVADVRDRLSKQTGAQIFDMEKFDLKKLNELDICEKFASKPQIGL
jgi:hypothetical protein